MVNEPQSEPGNCSGFHKQCLLGRKKEEKGRKEREGGKKEGRKEGRKKGRKRA